MTNPTNLENVKILLDIDDFDTYKDDLLNLYIQRANDYVMNYCGLTVIPESLNSTIEEMTCFSYRQRGVENIQSEGKGSLSEQYLTEYPPNIMNVLNSNARIRFI